ncbi:major facilitator superfamily domain-containing protein [Elsinoe ampelina]|uniref:Major facilitator superfamily domain-containing protein n=1 Tax=Elsinoe ampelina TaxID=302913 RepID=A0A6A6GQQ8_9PEZI|nr:major facilitator superfamily domain-containing protein [Elsinoe ampelina]
MDHDLEKASTKEAYHHSDNDTTSSSLSNLPDPEPTTSQHPGPPPLPPSTLPLAKTPTNTLTQTLSALTRVPTTLPITPPPDGGRQAWLQVLACHLAMSSCWGTVMSWGAYQTYYTDTLLPDLPQSTVSWIGSIQVTLIFFVGIASGRLTDGGYFYPVVWAGLFLEVLGVFMTSLCAEFWQLVMAQGICFGVGAGLSFTPMTALLSTYFQRKRAVAIAMAASGAATGGLVFPSVIRQLVPQVGFGWAVRVVAFIVLLFNGMSVFIMKWRLPPRQTGPWVDTTAFKDRTFLVAVGAMFFVFWAVYFAFFYVGVFGRTEIGLPYEQSVDLLLVMVAIGVPARIIPGLIADHYLGPMSTLIPIVVLATIMLLVWTVVTDVAGLYVFSALYGIGGAAIQSLFPAMLATLTPDIRVRGTRMGMGFFVASFAVLSGPPIAGELIRIRNGDFLGAQLWAGVSMALGLVLLITCRFAKVGPSFNTKI